MKKVSIITPFFKSEQYIEELIKSIISQTYKNIELIIVDDCSPLESFQILKKIVEKYSQHLDIKLFQNKENVGAANSRNTALLHATGEYITCIDSDDMLCGKFSLEKRVRFLDNSSEFSGVGGYTIKIDSDSKMVFPSDVPSVQHFQRAVENNNTLIEEYCLFALEETKTYLRVLFLLTGGFLFNSSVFKNIHFDEKYEKEEDVEWIIQFFEKGYKISLQTVPFHFRRMHDQQIHLAGISPTITELKDRMRILLSKSNFNLASS